MTPNARAATERSASRTATCRSPAASGSAWIGPAGAHDRQQAQLRDDAVGLHQPRHAFRGAKTLTPDEVYALTAYVLNLNDILPADAVLDRDSLPRVTMPNRDGLTTAHGFMTPRRQTRHAQCRVHERLRGTGSADVGNARPCARPARQCSASSRACSPRRRRPPRASRAWRLRAPSRARPAMASRKGRWTRLPGNRRDAIRGDGAAETGLVAKVKAGGAGNWGSVADARPGQLQDADVRALVQWILAGAN